MSKKVHDSVNRLFSYKRLVTMDFNRYRCDRSGGIVANKILSIVLDQNKDPIP